MKSVKYVDKDGIIYTVGEMQDPDGVEGFFAYICIDDFEKSFDAIEEIDFSTDLQMVENDLLKYVQDKGLVPVAIKSIVDDPKKIFQGVEITDAVDHVALSAEDFREKAGDYFDMEQQVGQLEQQKADKLKKVKVDYDCQINDLEESMNDLKPIMRSGCDKQICVASWERDADAEMMILVRKDNLKVLGIRTMSAEERQPEVFDDSPVEETEDKAETGQGKPAVNPDELTE